MIRFFREFRQQSLFNNRLSKYLAYAVGEVVLITVGIILAMEFNDWNEARKIEGRITGYLKQVHSELGDTIAYCDELSAHYLNLDNALREIMSGELTYEDYSDPEKRSNIGRNLQMELQMLVPDSGYQNLIKHSDSIPTEYRQIFAKLESIYTVPKASVEMSGEVLHNGVLSFWSSISREERWVSDHYFSNPARPWSKEEIEYYLSDPLYKNWISVLAALGPQRHYRDIANLRDRAVFAYEEISGILGLEEAEGLSCNLDVEDYRHWVGKYKVSSSNWEIPYDTLSIYIDEDRIMIKEDRPDATPQRRFPIDPTSYAFQNGFITFERDDEAQVIGLASRRGNRIVQYKKIE